MHFYSVADKYEVLEKINSSIELTTLLDQLGAEIEKIGKFDGYLINLLDSPGTHLESLKVRFTPEFHSLEATYLHYKVALAGELPNVNARAFKTLATVCANIDNGSTEEKQLLGLWKLHEIAAVPLVGWEAGKPNQPIGTLLLLKQQGPIDAAALKKVDELIALFHRPLCNARDYSVLKDYHDRFEAAAAEQARFLQFIVDMNNIISPERIFEMFTAELFHQLKFDALAFFLQEDDALVAKKVAVANPAHEKLAAEWQTYLHDHPYALHATDGGVAHTYLRNTPLTFPDVQTILHLPMSEKDRKTLAIFGNVRTLLAIPIRFQNEPIGVIIFFSLDRLLPISESDLTLLNNLSAFFGTAITNSRNYLLNQQQHREIERLNLMLQEKVKELAEQAATDRLTGLFNYRTFELELNRRISEFERRTDKEGLSIAVIDIDHFKKFNDSYGHNAGNAVLSGVAHEIAALVRKMDMACRYGGEEFVVILTKCNQDGIRVFAERMRRRIEKALFNTDAGTLSVTVSIGCTTYQPNDDYESFFKRADQALYRAKQNGRNRIESA